LPPIFKSFIPGIPVPETLSEIASTLPGQITLLGVFVCLVGIAVAAYAGLTKEREMPAAEKKKAIAEFNYGKGIMVATFSGIMSACFSFALTAGNPIGQAAAAAGTQELWTGLPKLVVVLAGGFTTNFIWCVLLNFRNRTGYQYFSRTLIMPGPKPGHAVNEGDGAAVAVAAGGPASRDNRVPMARNYFFSALAGTTWYMQFFFYTMGETQMGRFGFASWTLHMASIIIFSTMWGWIFHEWKGASKKSHGLIAGGIALLILSTIVIGLGTYLKG
jgi:L-rhamnose-H+ transport protein